MSLKGWVRITVAPRPHIMVPPGCRLKQSWLVEYSATSAASSIVHSSPASLVVGTADSHRGGLNPMRFHKFEDVLKPVPNAPAKLRIWNSLPLAAKISQGLDGDIGDPAHRLFPEVPNFFVSP